MSNRQKKVYQEAEKTQKIKKVAAKKLIEKKQKIDKAKTKKWSISCLIKELAISPLYYRFV